MAAPSAQQIAMVNSIGYDPRSGTRKLAVVATSENPRAIEVETTSTVVLPVNMARKGLSLVNDSANNIYISIETTAELHKDLILYPGGSWDGIISGCLWVGQVNAVASAPSNLLVMEI